MPRSSLILIFLSVFALGMASSVSAQSTDLAGCKVQQVSHLSGVRTTVKNEQGIDEMRVLLGGSPVQIDCDEMQLFAQEVEIFAGHRVVATGDVLFVSQGSRISAERLEFDTKTRTGTFFKAKGQSSLGDRVDRSMFGTQEPDMYFEGEEIHKIGTGKYKIVRGAFTTCVQPTPRWEMVSGTATITLDDHALLKNSVLRVKGVPIMYLPIFYYPVQDDDRATGFLIPVYGSSKLAGQSISNAFFWAISRSQDATLTHDWYSKTGQGYGGEYRYQLDGGNAGNSTFHFLDEHEATYTASDGSAQTTPAKRSYQLRGNLVQSLNRNLRARANVDYYSDLATEQRYQQNFNQATKTNRLIGVNLTGNWQEYVLGATVQRSDYFYNETNLTTTGGLPRITFNKGERPIGKSKVYFGVNSEYVMHIWKNEVDGVTVSDKGLTRLDVTPVLRVPFTRWPFLTVNSSVSWKGTYWTESLDLSNVQVPERIGRRYFDFQSRITGPVLNRIWNTPGSSYAEKFKHVIEPTFTIQRVTAIDNFDRIVQIDQVDRIVGNVTRYTYGVNNRIYAKKDVAREIVSVSLSQTYYTDATASQYDPSYQSSFNNTTPTNFSPIRIQSRVSPTVQLQGDFSTEWNPTAKALTSFSASGSYHASRFSVSGGWSERRLIPTLPGFDNPALANHDINASTTIRSRRNHLGGTYTFAYDLRNDRFRNQQYTAYYNAQCCGIAIEYQSYNLGGFSSFILPQDRRFNLSFTLAGIGTFSNFFGAFGGQNR